MRVININHDKHSDLLEKCKSLYEYSAFIELVRSHVKKDSENGFTKAIKECIDTGILQEYLKRKSSEVMNMLVAEYNYDLDIQVKQEEARKEGVQQGKLETARKMKSLGISNDIICRSTGLTLKEIEKL